ncbi:MAG: hypothetical protein WBP29_01780 [Candidatus Zixiibacteriota bacterium]
MIVPTLCLAVSSSGADEMEPWLTQCVTPDSLDCFVDHSDVKLIRAFEEWVQTHKTLIVQYGLPIWENPDAYRFIQFRYLMSDCFRLQVGELADSTLQTRLAMLDQTYLIKDQIDSVFAVPRNLLAWTEIEQACPSLMLSGRNFLDSNRSDEYTATISFNFGSQLVAEVSASGDSSVRDDFLSSFIDLYVIGMSPPICYRETFQRAKIQRVIQLVRFGRKAIHAAVPILDHEGRGIGEAVLIMINREPKLLPKAENAGSK